MDGIRFCDVKKGQQFLDRGMTYTKLDDSTGVTIGQHVKFFIWNSTVTLLIEN